MSKWKKTALSATIGAAMMAVLPGAGTSAAVSAPAPIAKVNVVLDDVPLVFDSLPRIENGTTLVPFRGIAEALGISVGWDDSKQTVTAAGAVNGKPLQVALRLGAKTATVNGSSVALRMPAVKRDGRVLVPLSFLSGQFGSQVAWNATTRTVTIVSPKREMHLRAFYALGSFAQRSLISSMNSVAFGWSRIDENGAFVTDGDDYRWPEPAGDVTGDTLVASSASAGTAPYLMVYAGDGHGELTRMMSDEALRTASIDGIARTAKDKAFAGVVIDFEGLGWKADPLSQQELLNEYTRLLSEKLTPLGIRLSLAVPPPNGSYKGYDYRKLAELADDLIVMAYDYRAPGTPAAPEPNAKVDEAIAMSLKAGVPKNKLLLGISVYNETADTLDDKLGLAKRYDLKGAAFWALRYFESEQSAKTDVMRRSVERVRAGNVEG